MTSIAQSVKSFTEDNFLNDKYLEYALDIAERVCSSSENQKDFIDTVKQRFSTGSAFIILQTLTLLDIVVKNANQFLKLDISSRSFVTVLRKLEKLNSDKVTDRLCAILNDWIKMNEFVGAEHDLIIEYQKELNGKRRMSLFGRDQSTTNDLLPISLTNGPSFTKNTSSLNYNDKFTEDLQKAINMSLIEHAASSQPSNKSEKSNVVKALFDFTDVEEGELMFRVGDRITIVDDSQPYWWKGICNGRVGLFPSTFVGPMDTIVSVQSDKIRNDNIEDILKIDETLLDKCLNTLKSADIEALPNSDPDDLLKLEKKCLKMGSLIEHEISTLDGLVDKCQLAHEQLLQAIHSYDHECQLEANRILSSNATTN